jgi:hypothetical protein
VPSLSLNVVEQLRLKGRPARSAELGHEIVGIGFGWVELS